MPAAANVVTGVELTAIELIAGFSHRGNLLLALLCGGGFALAFVLGTRRLNTFVAVTLFLIGPLAAILTYLVVNPDPGCTNDCPAKGAWSLILLFATLAWWAGLATGASVASAARRRSSN